MSARAADEEDVMRTHHLTSIAVLAGLALAGTACRRSPGGTDSGADGATVNDSGGPGDSGAAPDSGAGGDSAVGSDAANGTACGGFTGATCDATQYCDYPDDICGAADGSGTCTPRPQGCPDNYDPVCACDGTVYGNACDAAAAGSDVSSLGGCTPPPGYFDCAGELCNASTEFCWHYVDDTGLPDSWACMPLPICSIGGCACVEMAPPCAGTCVDGPGMAATYTCGGG
jgi:hypothetical protein